MGNKEHSRYLMKCSNGEFKSFKVSSTQQGVQQASIGLRARGVVRLTQARNQRDFRSVEGSAQAIGHRVLEVVELHLRLDRVEIPSEIARRS
ncbi:hypothetical protein LIER_35199 [Lithospermum erythrorhizon]|uniref:Uncharacterized protein n=1 Tax=Lithospermum erythrorhizon TaxID=34254 RepID=A0AAV3NLE7_LITER